MFTTLLESHRRRGRNFLQTALSTVLHLGLIAWAVRATAGAEAVTRASLRDTLIFAPPSQPTPPILRRPAPSEMPAIPAPRAEVPPLEVPTTIPPVVLDEPFDPRRYIGAALDSGPESEPGGGRQGGGSPEPETWLAGEVDVPAARLAGPEPRYPPALRQAGIDGRVLVQFVVDTAGRVEDDSWRVLETTHAAFTEAVRDAILESRFRPAQMRGRVVRQLVRLPVRFTLAP